MRIFDKESEARKYRIFFVDFLLLEIPNLIQIFTLVFVLNFLADDVLMSSVISLLVLLLFACYFITKLSHYIWEQFSNESSLFNVRKLDAQVALSNRYGIWYTCAMMFVLGLILVTLLAAVKLQPVFEYLDKLEQKL